MLLRYFVTTAIVIHSALGASFPVPQENVAKNTVKDSAEFRLPTNVKPKDYYIQLKPNLNSANFQGYTEIEIEVLQASNSITLHADHITIKEINVKPNSVGNSKNIFYNYTTSNDEKQFLILTLTEDLVPGTKYFILIRYTGLLHNDNAGFYLGKYETKDGQNRLFGTTQFESTSARRAFPCFDEPALKATFRIEIQRAATYNSVSNMKLTKSLDQGDGTFIDEFEPSVQMSTYLVAFVVSDFKNEAKGRQGVLATPENIDAQNHLFALDEGEAVLKAMEDYLGNVFPISKMDQVAIPNNYFAAGAMENWGLVTYREKYLLFMPEKSTNYEKQQIVTTIAHEFAHQWFGNLISPMWWKYIWLNEGFATYFEYHIAAEVEKVWRLDEQYLVNEVQKALEIDGLPTTRAMTTDAGSPSEISNLFDKIAYDKSGSVIRMWANILTPLAFRTALQAYFNEKSYSAAVPTDLYASFQKAIDELQPEDLLLPDAKDIKAVCENWETQAGYPLVTVTIDGTAKTMSLAQKRFLVVDDDGTDNSLWDIPINYATASNPNFTKTTPSLWLTAAKIESILLEDFPETDWVILNKKATGFYRIQYDENNYAKITEYLSKTENINKIDPLNRAQLIDDTFTLAKHGKINFEIALELSTYLKNEADYIPVKAFLNAISSIHNLMAGSSNYEALKGYIRAVLQGSYDKLHIDETATESHIDKVHRANVLNVLCKVDSGCENEALTRFRGWMTQKKNSITPNQESALLCAAIKAGTVEEWQFLSQKYQEETLDTTRARQLASLGCSQDSEILHSFMNASLNGDKTVRQTDRVDVFNSIMAVSTVGLEAVIDFVESNLEAIKANEGLGISGLTTVLTNIGVRATKAEQQNKIKSLKDSLPDQSALIDSVLSSIQKNIDWLATHEQSINKWLADGPYKPSPSSSCINVVNVTVMSVLTVITYFFKYLI